jgi:PAS domain S-box-containing protein
VSGNDERVRTVEHQLAVAQQITHIGSWEWDVATNSVSWSDELYRIYGFEPRSREITFEFFVSRLHPDDRERVQREVGAALERGARFGYPERIVRPDGSIRALDTVGEVSRDDSGRAVGLIGTCRDVTDDRRRDETIRLYADIVRNMQIGVAVWDVGEPDDLAAVRLVAFNPAAEKVARQSLGDAIGKRLLEILPHSEGGLLPKLVSAVARDGGVHEGVQDRARNPAHPDRAVAIKAFPLPGRRVGLAVEDITAATKVLRLQAAEHRMLERIAAGEGLPSVLATLVLAIEEHMPPAMGSILLLDAEGRHIHGVTAPNVPEEFSRAIEGAAIGPRAGSCGTAAHERRPVFVDDIEHSPLWADYFELARASGLRACWSTPIFATDGRVLGTFALYFRDVRAATPEDREIIDRATHLAGLAIERRQLEDQLRELSAHVEGVREDERTGIAREIHDELGQALTALKMDLAWLARRVSGESSVSGMTLLEKISAMSDMTDEVIDRVRRISAELRPGVLDDLGLLAAVEWQGQQFELRTEVPCTIRSNLGEERIDRELSTAAFRIFQEALTNVSRHASATHVDVRLEKKDGELTLEVRDDGVGIGPEASLSPRSLGLLGMRERARRLGGAVSVHAGPGGGTVVELHVPLARGKP